MRAAANGGIVSPNSVPYRVDGGVGKYGFTTWRVTGGGSDSASELFSRLKGKQVYRTRWLRRQGLFKGCCDQSYRKTVEHLNAVRCQPGATTLRTLANAAEKEADRIEQAIEARVIETLCQPDFDLEGRPLSPLSEQERALQTQPPEAIAAVLAECASEAGIEGVTAEELAANPIAYEVDSSEVRVAIDDVGVKKQKPARIAAAKGGGKKRAWTSVARVMYGPAAYTLTGESVPEVLCQLCALLVSSGLGRTPLLFLTDGQRSLKDAIFHFWEVRGGIRLVLDWYHLQKKCKELGSLGLAGTIAEKKVHIEQLKKLLWYGLVDRALLYLDNLPDSVVRRPQVVEQIKGYLERNRAHIPCYAARKKLGLHCSSNPGEKENDLVVSQRQKHNGMSWSEDGSHALGTLTALRRSGNELEHWLKTDELLFRLPEAA